MTIIVAASRGAVGLKRGGAFRALMLCLVQSQHPELSPHILVTGHCWLLSPFSLNSLLALPRVGQLCHPFHGQCPLGSPGPPKAPPDIQQSQTAQAGAVTLALAYFSWPSPAGWSHHTALWFAGCARVHPSLWAQLSSAETSDSVDAATTAKTQSLQKTQTTSSWPSSRLSAAEVQAELRHLQEACLLLRLRMGKSSRQSPRTGCRSTAACSPRRGCRPARGSVSAGCGSGAQYPGAADPGGPRAAGGQAAPADPPGKVLMAELLPLVSKQEPLGPRWLVLCWAEHSLLCEGGQHYLPSFEKISLLTEPFPWPGPPPVPQDLQQRQAASAP